MRKFVGLLAIACLALGLMTATASATHSNGEGPDKDFNTGSVKGPLATPFGTFPSQSHIDASTGPQGQGGTQGHWFTTVFGPPVLGGTVTFGGDVLCLVAQSIAGTNSAVWRGLVTFSETPLVPPGYGIIARNVDNGEGANDPPDAGGGALTGFNPPSTCPAVAIPVLPIEQGNYVVHDGI
jgi:hypothetical protein